MPNILKIRFVSLDLAAWTTCLSYKDASYLIVLNRRKLQDAKEFMALVLYQACCFHIAETST